MQSMIQDFFRKFREYILYCYHEITVRNKWTIDSVEIYFDNDLEQAVFHVNATTDTHQNVEMCTLPSASLYKELLQVCYSIGYYSEPLYDGNFEDEIIGQMRSQFENHPLFEESFKFGEVPME